MFTIYYYIPGQQSMLNLVLNARTVKGNCATALKNNTARPECILENTQVVGTYHRKRAGSG